MMKIFIGSSSNGQQVADRLDKLLGVDFEIERWYADTFDSGRSYIDSLTKKCRECDFAVIVLTADDPAVQRSVQKVLPRDNCIFEAGLFMGHLSLDPQRVFLVTELTSDSLPTDLLGLKSTPGTTLQIKAQNIRAQARDLGKHGRTFSYGQLLEEEESLGDDHCVVVQSAQPIELETTGPEKDVPGVIAARVRANMRKLRYHYFFHANPGTVDRIANLCLRLVTLSDAGHQVSLEQMEQHVELLRRRMRIHFLPDEPLVAFCVHKLMAEKPSLYLRDEDSTFVFWPKSDTAMRYVPLRRAVIDARSQEFFVWNRACEAAALDDKNMTYKHLLLEQGAECFAQSGATSAWESLLRVDPKRGSPPTNAEEASNARA